MAASGSSPPSRGELLTLAPGERQRCIASYLRQLIARLVPVSPSRLPADAPLSSLGLDSLLSVELQTACELDLGVAVSAADLLQSPGLAALAADLADRLVMEPVPDQPVREQSVGTYSLSYGQRALWLLHQLAPESQHHNLALAARIRPAAEAAALRAALQTLTDRHAALRTTFGAAGGDPVQRVHPRMEVACEELDVADWSPQELEIQAAEIGGRPFDLGQGPLLRAALFRHVPEGGDLLVVAAHHIALDFWSFVLLLEELQTLYSAAVQGEDIVLPPPAAQYPDFVRWQEERLAGPAGERLWAYWQERLAGELPRLELATDRPRRAVRDRRGATLGFALGRERTAHLKSLARECGTTLYSLLLAGFALLLQRSSGQEDILVGSPASGRSAARIAEVVGYVMNPLVLRLDLGGDPPLARFLERVAQTVLGALAHQDFPAQLLAERLQLDRSAGHAALFEVMFVFNRAHRPGQVGAVWLALGEAGAHVPLAGLDLETYPLRQDGTDLDLRLAMVEADGEVAGSFVYDADLFDRVTVARMAGHLRMFLESLAPGAKCLSELSLLSPAERQQILLECNDTETEPGEPTAVHRLVAEQAGRRPEAPAVVAPGQVLSYAELDQRANRLAHHLQDLGVGPEVRVALFLERSPDLIVALLGVLKAGGAYVPVDPACPRERIAFLLVDAQTPVVLTQERLYMRLPALPLEVICLDAERQTIAARSATPPADLTCAQSLAYVLYTSGSAGWPKGVLVEHDSLAAYTATAADAYAISPQDRVLQFASISFDTSAEEIYPCLSRGAALVLRTEALERTMDDFVATCRERQVTVLDLPTSFWHEWVSSLGAAAQMPPAVRLVILGGERARPEQVGAWREWMGALPRLVNTYGPTEGTIVATAWDLSGPAFPADAEEVPIGRPVRRTRVMLLDRLRPVPLGVPAELHIAGEGVARGYLDRPELTAERFVPDPWAPHPGGRLYRTGDLARRRPDGSLEFAGRIDHQVKIRGFRVELGEIETALGRHPGVREVAVIAREDISDERQLVAYVVPVGTALAATELRRHLEERLPKYMVPAVFVLLEAFPRTGSGKLDRRALPVPDQGGAAGGSVPRTATEEIVVGICSEVLGRELIGTHDNLFHLGCHSLLAMKIVARLREAFGVELPLIDLFATPTVSELAATIEGTARSDRDELPPIERTSRDVELPLSFAQERIWFLTQLDPGLRSYHVPRALRVRGRFDPALVAAAFSEINRRHEILRTTFPAIEGRPVQVIHPPSRVALPMVDLSALPVSKREEELRRRIMEESRRSFDLVAGPLLRLNLLRLASQEHALVMTEHHLVHDGWTQGVLLRDFLTLYDAFARGEPSPLPELPVQYADFAVWQRRWLRDEILERQLAYWKERLAGAAALLDLPADRPRPAVQSSRGDQVALVLPAVLGRALRALGRSQNATLFMTMLSAWDALLMRTSGQQDFCVGTGVANRRVMEVEGLLGMVINTLVLRTDLSGSLRFAELVERVRTVCVGAYAHQDLPFEKLVAALRLPRSLSHTPLFQVFFAFLDTPMPELEIPGLSIDVLDAHNGSAKFDINMTVLLPNEQRMGFAGGARQDEITLLCEYSTDIFDRTTVLRTIGHFEVLLAAIAADSRLPLPHLPLLGAAEAHQLLAEWNDAAAEPAAELCLHELVFEQARRTPVALAVRCAGERLTYDELAARAQHLAAGLCARGVGPGDLIGLCIDRSAEMVVAVLGVLAAGAAYVPLDPTYPRERLALMIEDAQLALLLTEERLAGALPPLAPLFLMESGGGESAGPRAIPATLDDLAYVIYTSGSTGRPKGVAVSHRAAVHLLATMRRSPGLVSTDAVLGLTTLSFDISVPELFLPLSVGASVVVATREAARSGQELQAALADPAITTVQATPATWRVLLESGWEGDPRLRVLCTGEVLPWELADRLVGRCGELWNLYGPTETTVYSLFQQAAARIGGSGSVPVGRPLAHASAHLLDPDLVPVPIGVPGELWIGGRGLARGYLRRPELTAAAFRPDPLAAEPGARLYRTGDLARRLPDGTVEFLGRIDHQVKVRGFRVELGEIEALLTAHAAVGQAAAIVREDRPGDRRIVAYLVAGRERAASGELRAYLKRYLPDYMVPAAFVLLEAMPLTPSGKVDRRSLAALEASAPGPEVPFLAPRTSVESVVATMWSQVLGVDRVGVHDNFFDLGGHSLLATQLLARVRGAFQVEVPLRRLYKTPTVAELAQAIAAGEARPGGSERIARLLAGIQSLSGAELQAELQTRKARVGSA